VLNTKIPTNSCLFGRPLVQNPFLLLAGALSFDEKCALFWFGVRNVGFLPIFYSLVVFQKKVVYFPAFSGDQFLKKIAVCAHTIRLPKKNDDRRYFSMKWLRTLSLIKKIRTKIQNSTTYSG
jgi:hypothetical protein